jgi:hypothetical protein
VPPWATADPEPLAGPSPEGVGDRPLWARLSGPASATGPAAATVAAAQWAAARERLQRRGGQELVDEAEAARRVLVLAAQESPCSAVESEQGLWLEAVQHVANKALHVEPCAAPAGAASAVAVPAVAAVPPVPAQDASLLREVEAVQRDFEHIAAVQERLAALHCRTRQEMFVLQDSVAQLQERLAALHSMAGGPGPR